MCFFVYMSDHNQSDLKTFTITINVNIIPQEMLKNI